MSITVKTFLWCFGIATFLSMAVGNAYPYVVALFAWWLIANALISEEETKAKHKEELADQRRRVESETRSRIKEEEIERLRRENQVIDKAVNQSVESKKHELTQTIDSKRSNSKASIFHCGKCWKQHSTSKKRTFIVSCSCGHRFRVSTETDIPHIHEISNTT